MGDSNNVGCIDNYLWSPQAVVIGESLYFIMCKGCNIFIRRYCYQNQSWDAFYGRPIFTYSHLNFPRGCVFSKDIELLAVADTYHDRVVIFDLDGNIRQKIDSSIIKNLHWPRCVKWIADDLYIVNSTSREVIKISNDCLTGQRISIPGNLLPKGQWMQAFDLMDGTMLLAFERQVLLWDTGSQNIKWTSERKLELNDVHYAQLISKDSLLITDTGNNRGLLIENGHIKEICCVYEAGKSIFFILPAFFS